MSAPSSFAFARMVAHGTITPMLTTSKLLHWSTTDTMFLPMSCTSPLTVAITILPFGRTSAPASAMRFFSSSMYGIRCATACFITRADLTTCGRNILPAPNRSPTMFMPSISGPSITLIGRPPACSIFARTSSVSSTMKFVMPCTSACERRSSTGWLRHSRFSSFFAAPVLKRVGDFEQTVGAVSAAVQHHVFDAFAQFGIEVLIHAELTGIDDAHVHAGLDRVIQEHGVDRLAHRIVAAKRERHVRHAAAHLRVRQVFLDPARRVDEVDGVVVVLFDARRDREDVRVEDDVFRREAHFVHEEIVRALADLRLALEGVGLALFVEGHHHGGRAVAANQRRVVTERVFAFLQRDRVDDRLALHALQAGLDHFPLRRVDHDRHARDVRFRCDQIQEADHCRFRIEHRFVHVDVDDLRAVLDLLARDGERFVELVVQDHAREGLRSGHVGALTDVDEERAVR